MFKNDSKLKRYLIFAALVSPALILRFSMSFYPIVRTIYLSFYRHNLMEQVHRYVGLGNYRALLNDQTIVDVIAFTIIFIVVSVFLQLILGMAVANLLNVDFKGRKFMRTLNLLPWVIPVIVSGYVFRWMLNADYGLITDWIYRLTGNQVQLLINSFYARISLILVNVWRNTPFMAIVLLAGLQSIPGELYEAAKIDGASWLQRFVHITLPASYSTIVTLGLFNIIWQIANIDLILGLTQGGPGSSTTVIAFRIYQLGMQWFSWGRASALSVYLLLIVALMSLVALYLYKKFEFTS